MGKTIKYYIVAAEALPEIFVKVAEAKRMMQAGEAGTVGEATKLVGISRSAFYKYKDSVFLYDERMNENIVSFSLALEDRPGVLSNLLAQFYQLGANVITVNQNIPIDGVAIASVSIRTADATRSRSQILDMLGKLDGVVEAKSV